MVGNGTFAALTLLKEACGGWSQSGTEAADAVIEHTHMRRAHAGQLALFCSRGAHHFLMDREEGSAGPIPGV
jgi:hypothetical protein